MNNRRPRPFRRRSNGRNFRRRRNNNESNRLVSGSFASNRGKNNFKPQESAEKLLESYKILAKEAVSLGDKILAENYLQHIDHFERIVSNKNLNQNNNLSNSSETNQDHINKNNQDHINKNKG